MSEEEKQALDRIKRILYMFPETNDFKIILNLVDKQQKEIKVLKNIVFERGEIIEKQQEEIEELKSFINLGNLEEMYILLNAKTSECEDIRNERDRALKVIDNMAERFSKDYCFADLKNKCNRGAKDFSKEKCISCIKDYFYKEIE